MPPAGVHHFRHRDVDVGAMGVEGGQDVAEGTHLRPSIVPEGGGVPVPQRHLRQAAVLRDEALDVTPARRVRLRPATVVPKSDPIRPRITLAGEAIVYMAQQETLEIGRAHV